jgi:hypothetical protein
VLHQVEGGDKHLPFGIATWGEGRNHGLTRVRWVRRACREDLSRRKAHTHTTKQGYATQSEAEPKAPKPQWNLITHRERQMKRPASRKQKGEPWSFLHAPQFPCRRTRFVVTSGGPCGWPPLVAHSWALLERHC